MADREETKKSQSGKKEGPSSNNTSCVQEEESSASEYEEIIEEVTDYSEAESDTEAAEIPKDKEKSSVVTKSENFSSKIETFKDQSSEQVETIFKETDKKTECKTKNNNIQESAQLNNKNDKSDSSEKGESLKQPVVHDSLYQQIKPKEGSSYEPTNSQKLKSIQTNSNNKTVDHIKPVTYSESSSMYAPYNKTQKPTSSASNSSQNPTVTVQTADRTDLTSLNNNFRNKNSSSSLGSNPVVVGSDSPRQVDRLGVPHKEDSGTESGEDLRLIAAGLRDQLQIQSDSNIIEDVTYALNRLENSLKDGKDISVDTEKRKALLALVDRLRASLNSPEKLAEIAIAMSELDGGSGLYGETSSPEEDGHRSNRNRFSKRKGRVNRHTVGVSREELADARRCMENKIIMDTISQNTTPKINNSNINTPSQWCPTEKNTSTSFMSNQSSPTVLQRPKQFVFEDNSCVPVNNKLSVNNNSSKRRPLSGEYSVTFESPSKYKQNEMNQCLKQDSPPEDHSKFSRFSNKRHLMKRANTIDFAKTRKYNSEFDTDSDAEDKEPQLGLKRAVQVSVKKRVQNAVPPFEPKTENDRKFLAFINKQSDKPGLGWTSSRSVSNWANKFGSIKSTFEGGLTSKPPQVPYNTSSSKSFQSNKLFNQQVANTTAPPYVQSNQQIALRLQHEAERQAKERRTNLEKENLEYERRERDKLERQRQENERQEKERFERQRKEREQIAAVQHANILREQEQLASAQQATGSVPEPIPINEFKHAPQSVFRPIDSGNSPTKPIYRPIPLHPRSTNIWQPGKEHINNLSLPSSSQYGNTRPDNSFITSPPPSSRSPIGLPWSSKPTVDNSSFKSKANKFEERSKYDNMPNTQSYLQRHHSLRLLNDNSNQINDNFRKRPSLPNTYDPCSIKQILPQQNPLANLPPPQNISFTYGNPKLNVTHKSQPCLPTAVFNNFNDSDYEREDSLTNPNSVPLVLTSSNPSYCPPQQQHQSNQARLFPQYDVVSQSNSMPSSPMPATPQTNYTDNDIDSDNLLEYHAVSRVMGKPQSQTAVTVERRTGHVSDDELYGKNSRAARNLLSTMKSIGNPNVDNKLKVSEIKRPETVTRPKLCLSPDGRSYQAPIVEPLFPEVTNYETNRKPFYFDQSKKQTEAPTHSESVKRKQLSIYKSLEDLNRSHTTKHSSSSTKSSLQTQSKPYLSETKTSFVATYPMEDTTDDEDFNRSGQKNIMPPTSLNLQRQRNVSDNSTGSSTTTSLSYGHNLPSPNTSWTSNPIATGEPINNSNIQTQHQTPNQSLQQFSLETKYQTDSQVTSNYSGLSSNSLQSKTNYVQTPSMKTSSDYTKTSQPEAQPQRQKPQIANQQVSINQTQQPLLQEQMSVPKYSGKVQQKQQTQHSANQVQTSNVTYKESAQIERQKENTQKPQTTQKPTDYSKGIQTTKQVSKTTTTTSVLTSQEKKSLPKMRKAASQDHDKIRTQNPNISQKTVTRLDQQQEQTSKEVRSKSLGNALDFEMQKQSKFDSQLSKTYKSSAPADTPDIVKSSLPKDESQPILKKFGPPQRHHYVPNAYQCPSASTTKTSTSTQSANILTKSVHTSYNKVAVKSSQQVLTSNKPTIIETPATPQPDDDYIPRNIVFKNIHAFTLMSRRQSDDSSASRQHQLQPNKLSKSDSWNQLMLLQNQHTSSNLSKYNQSPTNELRRTKSGHTLTLPKMYEATMTKTDITEKQKTVAAYFSGQKSPTHQEMFLEQHQNKRSVINRTKTSEKVSTANRKSLVYNHPIALSGLTRSKTMPHIANLNLLDESNVEDAFEQLILGS